VWVQHFKHKPHIKNDAAEIFRQLSNLASQLQLEKGNFERQAQAAASTESALREELSKLTLEQRRLRQSAEAKNKLARAVAGAVAVERFAAPALAILARGLPTAPPPAGVPRSEREGIRLRLDV